MRRLALCLGLLLGLVPVAAWGQQAVRAPRPRQPPASPTFLPRPPSPRPVATATVAVPPVVSSVELDVGTLPLVTIPAPLKLSERPAQLIGPDAPGVALINPSATMDPPKTQVRRGPSGSVSRRIEGTAPLPTSFVLQDGTTGQERLMVNCNPGAPPGATPLRWETFSIRPDGGAIWAIHDGWFDQVACRVTEQRSVVVQPRALALLSDQPVAFALRTAEGILVLYPIVDGVLGDAMTGSVKLNRGPIARVFVPLTRGSSATVITTHNLSRMGTWLAAAEGKAAGGVSLGNGTLTVRLEIAQTVSEDSPTMLLNLRSVPSR